MLKMRKIAARYSFQHACHATSNRAENWRRVAPKYAHICTQKIPNLQNAEIHHFLIRDFTIFCTRK